MLLSSQRYCILGCMHADMAIECLPCHTSVVMPCAMKPDWCVITISWGFDGQYQTCFGFLAGWGTAIGGWCKWACLVRQACLDHRGRQNQKVVERLEGCLVAFVPSTRYKLMHGRHTWCMLDYCMTTSEILLSGQFSATAIFVVHVARYCMNHVCLLASPIGSTRTEWWHICMLSHRYVMLLPLSNASLC